MQTNIRDSKRLVSTEFPYLVCRLSPGVFSFVRLPSNWTRQRLTDYCAAAVKNAKRQHALVLGPRECIYVEADGTRSVSRQPPCGGFAVSQDTLDSVAGLPAAANLRIVDPEWGVEVSRDKETGCCRRLKRARGKKPWTLREYSWGYDGRVNCEVLCQGDAAAIYRYADEIGWAQDDLAKAGAAAGLPTPQAIYDRLVEEALIGQQFSCGVPGTLIEWHVRYSVFRREGGWYFRVISEAENIDLLDGPRIEQQGPFRTKGEVRAALGERGLDSGVKF